MQLSQISLAITRLGGVPFNPAALFTAGEQGAWYDPSDLTTLFQDSAGTTPVTAVEQAVGLMLDKSKGATAGPNVVINGNFTTDSDWTKGTGWTITGGAAQGTTIGGLLTQSGVLVSGTWYKATVVISAWTGSYSLTVGFGATNTFIITAYTAGTYTGYFVAPSNDLVLRVNTGSGVPGTISVDSLVVQALPGNHAYQSTSTSRPVLRARYNLLTYSEQFDNAAWTKIASSVSANATTSPDGATTADKLVENASNAEHYAAYSTGLMASTASYTLSVFAKVSERSFLWLYTFDGTSAQRAWFNLATGAVGTVQAGSTAAITSVGNGWYRCSITRSITGNALANGGLGISNADNVTTYTGDGTSGIFVWGAQLIVTNSLTSNAYQRIAAATDYNTSGFLPYLSFDGTDDSLLTNSVDFTATDKMTVWAGLRKLSDAATGMLLESSVNAGSNNGAFFFDAPDSATSNYGFGAKGSAAGLGYYLPSTFAAPITNVFAGQLDLSQASLATQVIPRVNGTVVQTGGANQASGGNFGNYPLYIGARAGTSLWFNGWLTSLIVRGAQSSAAQISATEAWVNSKTGAY